MVTGKEEGTVYRRGRGSGEERIMRKRKRRGMDIRAKRES